MPHGSGPVAGIASGPSQSPRLVNDQPNAPTGIQFVPVEFSSARDYFHDPGGTAGSHTFTFHVPGDRVWRIDRIALTVIANNGVSGAAYAQIFAGDYSFSNLIDVLNPPTIGAAEYSHLYIPKSGTITIAVALPDSGVDNQAFARIDYAAGDWSTVPYGGGGAV